MGATPPSDDRSRSRGGPTRLDPRGDVHCVPSVSPDDSVSWLVGAAASMRRVADGVVAECTLMRGVTDVLLEETAAVRAALSTDSLAAIGTAIDRFDIVLANRRADVLPQLTRLAVDREQQWSTARSLQLRWLDSADPSVGETRWSIAALLASSSTLAVTTANLHASRVRSIATLRESHSVAGPRERAVLPAFVRALEDLAAIDAAFTVDLRFVSQSVASLLDD